MIFFRDDLFFFGDALFFFGDAVIFFGDVMMGADIVYLVYSQPDDKLKLGLGVIARKSLN